MSYQLEGTPGNVETGSGVIVNSGSTHTVEYHHITVIINKTVGSATAITLPLNPILWVNYSVKDAKGDAATNNITIMPSSGTIDGASSAVINANYGAVSLVWSGSAWSII